MEKTEKLSPLEISDETLFTDGFKKGLKVLGLYFIVLAVFTAISIWSVDFRKNSSFNSLKQQVVEETAPKIQ